MSISAVLGYCAGYLVLGFLTFFISFYVEGKWLAEVEGDFDPELSGLDVKLVYCLFGWPVIIFCFLAWFIVDTLSKLSEKTILLIRKLYRVTTNKSLMIAHEIYRSGYYRNRKKQ